MQQNYEEHLASQLKRSFWDARDQVANLYSRREALMGALTEIEAQIVKAQNLQNALETSLSRTDPEMKKVQWHFSHDFHADNADSHIPNPFQTNGELDFDPEEKVVIDREYEMEYDSFHSLFNFRTLDGDCTIYATTSVEIEKAFLAILKGSYGNADKTEQG